MDVISTDSSLLLYQTDDGQTKIEVRLQDETVWLNQAQLCELFDKDKRTISEHIQNIFKKFVVMYRTHNGIASVAAEARTAQAMSALKSLR